jgi:hypothetical protein
MQFLATYLEMAQFCENLMAAWASPLAARGDTPGLCPEPPTVPNHAGTFTASCAPSLTTFLQTSRSSIPWLLRTFIQPPAPLAMQLLFRTPTSAGTTLPTIIARDMHSERSLLKHWGGLVPQPCNSPAKPPTLPSPSPGLSVPLASPMRTASCP